MAPKVLRRMNTAGLAEDFELGGARCGVGISWDTKHGAAKEVDVDLQCVVVNNKGAIVDCAYYNNLRAANAITHSGDDTTGAAAGIDEMIWVNMPKLEDSVQLLVFVVAAYSGGCLKDVQNGKLHIFEDSKTKETARFEMERSEGSVDVVAAMFRDRSGKGWNLRIIDEPAKEGQHFMDILPFLGEVIRGFIPEAPKRHKVAFAMDKGGVLDLPRTMQSITVGLGWDTDEGEIDLDVSAVMLTADGKEVETVFFGNLESDHGITHSGDNLTGEGDGDDEQVTAVLDRIGPAVQQVVFVINVYTPRKSFKDVANPYCRVIDNATSSELCRYCLKEAGRESGLVVARLSREAGDRWGFHALGVPCRGQTYKDSMRQILQLCHTDTKSLLVRSSSEESFLRAEGFAPFAAPSPSAPPCYSGGGYAAGGYAAAARPGAAGRLPAVPGGG